jgi:hypothetical protein
VRLPALMERLPSRSARLSPPDTALFMIIISPRHNGAVGLQSQAWLYPQAISITQLKRPPGTLLTTSISPTLLHRRPESPYAELSNTLIADGFCRPLGTFDILALSPKVNIFPSEVTIIERITRGSDCHRSCPCRYIALPISVISPCHKHCRRILKAGSGLYPQQWPPHR